MKPKRVVYGGGQTIALGDTYDNIKPHVTIEFELEEGEDLNAETVGEIQEQWGELFDLCTQQHWEKVKRRRKEGLDDG